MTSGNTPAELIELVLGRIGQDFDGECHLTEAEARNVADQLTVLTARVAELETDIERRTKALRQVNDRAWQREDGEWRYDILSVVVPILDADIEAMRGRNKAMRAALTGEQG